MDGLTRLQTFFQTLADANRLRIVRFIGGGQRSVSEIVAQTGLSQPLVSHHLRVLRDQGILETRREGPFVYHRLKDGRVADILGLSAEIVASLAGNEKIRQTFCCPPWMRRGPGSSK